MNEPRPPTELDVAIVGAGFAGLYALHRLRGLGFTCCAYEAAADVGGVWYWNRYPGARCDVESLQYSYSFSNELEQEWCWSERYASQPEILAYINHVADRFDLRRDIRFATTIAAAHFDEASDRWTVRTTSGETIVARFLVMASGGLSSAQVPSFEGLDAFQGRWFHTGRWPHEPVDFGGRRVAVIGTGSSGIQTIPAIARQAAHVTVLQRTPNFSIPGRNRPLADEDQQAWKVRYAEHRARAREVGTLYEFSDRGAVQASEAERLAEYERRWVKGGVAFMHSFNDLMIDEASNTTAAEFVRARIREKVRDPAVAEMLTPRDHPIGSKRICVDTEYFETYNRDNVALIDVRRQPIERITATGILTSGGEVEVDDIVFATGYDALSGALSAIDIRGIGGRTLKDKWAGGPRSYLGLMTEGFPNMFTVTGAGSPSVLVNMIVGIEQHVDWIGACLAHLREHGYTRIDADAQAEQRWGDHVNAAANRTLFPRANSWYVGANIPGKPRQFMLYVQKIGVYRRECDDVASKDYEGFELRTPGARTDFHAGEDPDLLESRAKAGSKFPSGLTVFP